MTRIDPVTRRMPSYQPQIADEKPQFVARVDQPVYYKDTIGSATEQDYIYDTPMKLATKQLTPTEAVLMQPILEKPCNITKDTVIYADDEMAKITNTKKALSTNVLPNNVNRQEVELQKLLIACMKVQRDQIEVDGQLSLETVRKNQKANSEIQKDFFKKYDEMIERSKTSKKLSWVNKIVTGALFVVGAIGLGFTIATGGAALPLVLTIAGGILSISSGSVTITQSVLDYKNTKQQGVMFELKAYREMNQERINKGMEEMQKSVDFVAQNWKQLRKILNNIYQASLQTTK